MDYGAATETFAKFAGASDLPRRPRADASPATMRVLGVLVCRYFIIENAITEAEVPRVFKCAFVPPRRANLLT
jgi:hypothetical protein